MTKRTKLALTAILIGLACMIGACSTGEVIQQTAQAGYTLSAATPSAGGLGLSSGHR